MHYTLDIYYMNIIYNSVRKKIVMLICSTEKNKSILNKYWTFPVKIYYVINKKKKKNVHIGTAFIANNYNIIILCWNKKNNNKIIIEFNS